MEELDKNSGYKYFAYLAHDPDKQESIKPYPNFDKEYSCLWEIEPDLIQVDWKNAAIEHLEYWKTYFTRSIIEPRAGLNINQAVSFIDDTLIRLSK